jgi:hypothetical protein
MRIMDVNRTASRINGSMLSDRIFHRGYELTVNSSNVVYTLVRNIAANSGALVNRAG